MNAIIILTYVIVGMVVNSNGGGFGTWPDNRHVDTCRLRTDCGPKGGLFTDFCDVVCRAGGFKGSACLNFVDQGYAVCSCKGNGDSEKFLKANCELLCELGCSSCGYKKSRCTSEPKTVKSAIRCNCM